MGAVRVGVIGLGKIAEAVHLPGLASSPNAEIHAICDKNPARLKEIGERYAIPPERRFQDYRDLITLPEIEAVDIATPNFAHLEPVMAAYENGKHVCVEKPLALNYPQALEMEARARKSGVTTMVCFSFRFNPAVRFARWIIDEGGIGKILTVYVQYLKSAAFDTTRGLEWRFQKELAGSGVLGDLGSHMIDMTRFLAGDIDSVCSKTGIAVAERKKLDSNQMGQVSTDDSCSAIASLACGGHASIILSRCAVAVGNENSAKIAIYGDRGMVRLDSEKPFEIEACSGKLDFTTGSAHTFKVPKSFQAEQMDSFVKNVVGNPDRYLPGLEDGVRCQKILDAMVDSDRNGKWVDV
jgi:predicted dehydrogenase